MHILILLSLFVGINTYAGSPKGYHSLTPVAGDDHHHGGSLIGNFVTHQKVQGNTPCPHNFGKPVDIYNMNQAAGFDWLVLAHHDRASQGGMTGDPNGKSVFGSYPGAYDWWIHPNSSPIRKPDGSIFLQPNPNGLPDYVTGGTVTPGWNESASLSSAATFKNTTSTGFAAIAGREYTTNQGAATGVLPGRGGHKIVVLPNNSSKICGYLYGMQGEDNECDETQLYQWVESLKGAIIQAHPGDWSNGLTPWNAQTARAGMSEQYVHGVEVGTMYGMGLAWENGYQNALGRGYRLFPSYGTDRHNLQLSELNIGCSNNNSPDLALGSVVCWVPNDQLSPIAIANAMRARQCYYSRSYKPRLEFEVRSSVYGLPYLMGEKIKIPSLVAWVRVHAQNDLRNQTTALARRFNRLELVHVSGYPAVETVVHACTNCCTTDDTYGDRCTIEEPTMSVRDGALYARVCKGTSACGRNGANTLVVGAPIFINWEQYRATQGLPPN